MNTWTVGCVPYVNALPLIAGLEEQGVAVKLAVPSALPAMLDSHSVDAILVSSFDALTTPGRRVVAGIAIASEGPVESVRLFSKVPIPDVRTVRLDSSSLTSNALLRLLLEEKRGLEIEWRQEPMPWEVALDGVDAALLIGDAGMLHPTEGLFVLDLGEDWTDWTGLPFIWAMWTGRDDLSSQLASALVASLDRRWGRGRQAGDARANALMKQAAQMVPWRESDLIRYLTQTMIYEVDSWAMQGLEAYAHHLVKSGSVAFAAVPPLVRGGEVSFSP